MTKLPDFEGHPVIGTTIKVTRAGDGLSKSLAVDPVVLHHGGRHVVMMEVEVVDIQFPRVKDDPNNVIRKAVLEASTALIVDTDLAREMVAAHRAKLARAHDEASGKIAVSSEAAGNGPGVDADPRPTAGVPVDSEGFYDPALEERG